MPRFSANISVMFEEYDFLDRFQIAKECGFNAVEIQFPYEIPANKLVATKQNVGVDIILINVGAGDLTSGGPGIAAYPGREKEFKVAVEKAYEYAEILNVRFVNVLAGSPPLDEFDEANCLDIFSSNLNYAAAEFEKIGVMVLTEAVNTKDRPGFLISTTSAAIGAIDRAKHGNLAIQYDLYHMQIMEENLVETIRGNLDRIGHIQFADTPGRKEPGTGEINFSYVFDAIDRMDWQGWLGAEDIPSIRTESTLGWMTG